MPLKTPFGEIFVELNGKPCEYKCEALPTEVLGSQGLLMFKVEGRYKIAPIIDETVSFLLKLKCRVDSDLVFDDFSECETGERYSAASMYHGGIKMSIGAYDEIDEVLKYGEGWSQIVDGGLILEQYTTTSIEIYVSERKYMGYAFFGVAWTTLRSDKFETDGSFDVWTAAEPWLMT